MAFSSSSFRSSGRGVLGAWNMPPPPKVTGTPTFKAPPIGRAKAAQKPPPPPLPKLEEGDEEKEKEDKWRKMRVREEEKG